ncbi:MAG: hypothetical protein DMG56_18535 [Acidobacteria bacterium]|nr:MAG: hypothetical protein DMG56_18535 [Acidobacteriota bacterium]
MFDFAPSLHGVHRFDSAAMKFEDWQDGPAQFLGYFHLLHACLAAYASDQVAALGTDALLVGWCELHILTLNVVPSCKYMPVSRKTSSRKKKLELVCRPGQGISCICGKLTFSLVYLRTGLVNKSAVLGEK